MHGDPMRVTVDNSECAQVPLDEDEEVEVALAKGQSVSIKYKASGEMQADGKRCAVSSCVAVRQLGAGSGRHDGRRTDAGSTEPN